MMRMTPSEMRVLKLCSPPQVFAPRATSRPRRAPPRCDPDRRRLVGHARGDTQYAPRSSIVDDQEQNVRLLERLAAARWHIQCLDGAALHGRAGT